MVSDLEIKLVGTGSHFQEPGIFAAVRAGAVVAGTFDTDSGFDVRIQRNGVKIQRVSQQIQRIHFSDRFAVLDREQRNGVHIFTVPPGAEVVVFALSQYSSQRVFNKAEIRKHFRKCRDFFLHNGLLQLNAGCGDRYWVTHEGVRLIEEFGYETCNEVCHGLAGTDFCFAESDFPEPQAEKDGLCHFELLFPEGVTILGHDHLKDDIDELDGRIGTRTFVALIACVLDGVKDLGEDRGVFGHLKRVFTFSDP